MLVLTRELNERVFLDTADGRIEIVVIETRSDKVRLGFEAPASVAIQRDNAKLKTPRERRLGG